MHGAGKLLASSGEQGVAISVGFPLVSLGGATEFLSFVAPGLGWSSGDGMVPAGLL